MTNETRMPLLALLVAVLCLGTSAAPAQDPVDSSSQPATATITGQVDMQVDDDIEIESVRLHTYRDDESSTAQWTNLVNSPGIGLYIHAFPSSQMMPDNNAITLSMRVLSLDLQCPCKPEAAGLRLYDRGQMDAFLYRSMTPEVTLETIERQGDGRVRLVGQFNAELAFYRDLRGAPDPTNTVRVEGSFDVVSDPI